MPETNAVTQGVRNLSYTDATAITPDNSGTHEFNSVCATVAGVITVDLVGGSTNVAVPIGAGLPVNYKISRVYATGTTATGIVGLNARD